MKLLMSPCALLFSKTVLQTSGSDKETSLEHTRFKKGKNPCPALLSPFQWSRSQHHGFYPVILVSCLMHIINPQWFGLQLCAEIWQSLLSLTMLPSNTPQLEIPGLLKKKNSRYKVRLKELKISLQSSLLSSPCAREHWVGKKIPFFKMKFLLHTLTRIYLMSHKGQAKIKDQKYSQIYVNKMT